MIADAATLAAADRRSAAIARDWQAGEAYRSLDAAFARVDSDDGDAVADVAERLLRDACWLGPLLAPLIAALNDDSWFEPPLRVSRDPLRTGAILYEGTAVRLTAVVLSADALAAAPAAATVVASGRLAVVRYVRAGGARLRCWHVGRIDGELATETAAPAQETAPLALCDEAVVRQDGRDHAYLLEGAGSDVATLTITMRGGAARYAREYRRSDGAFLKSAALDDAPARSAMLLALLRLSGRSDAAAAFDHATRDDVFFLRWQAMREWLALDAVAAAHRLAEMARDDPNAEIRAAACATLRLVEQRRVELCPRLIDPGDGDAIDLEALVEALDASDFDPRDEDAFAAMGPWLARLGRNRRFLADLAIAELEQRFAGQAASAYGAQVLLLRPPNGRFLLRANFWPARNDAAVRANGTAPFFYDLPHDHNFDFLTVGYLGPGYWSDYYEFGGDALGLPGEPANLTFVERSRLAEGKLMFYRAHRDVHVQLPPDSFSVSLNILGYDLAQPWRSQYRFDIASDTIVEALTVTPSEALVTLAAQFGGEAGIGLAREMAWRHPVPRMRATALSALASAAGSREARGAVYEIAVDDADAHVAGHARQRLAALR